ncbi:MAG TPA: hypothetical protein HPP77_09385, partial [Candidatus Hydrogenedentes bacterium]|nr:hypothetical protein [Candidatus Hydrogenedentota bacterium]
MRTITWLHISDLHTNNPKYGWDYDKVTEDLVKDLNRVQRDHKLEPDFIFVTGDLAYGREEGDPDTVLDDQYKHAGEFLETVRKTFGDDFSREDVFIIPGNHDVDVTKHNAGLRTWLAQEPPPSLDEIHDLLHKGTGIWPQFMDKLRRYQEFLKDFGYGHLLDGNGDGTRVPDRGVYAVIRERHGLKIAIAGLNSPWSSAGAGKSERGALRLGGKRQLGFLRKTFDKADFAIALMHHPVNWFAADEGSSFDDALAAQFRFLLHGHEHANRVRPVDQCTRIGAGACYKQQEKETGYNFVRLDLDNQVGEVWMRRYSPEYDGGWIPYVLPNNRTNNDGMKKLEASLTWLKELDLAPPPTEPPDESEAAPVEIRSTPAPGPGRLAPATELVMGEALSAQELELVAIPPDILADYLCQLGALSLIRNTYVSPDLDSIGGVPGALSRLYVGPADCGKTRAALEWIIDKVGPEPNAWTVLRPETGSIPREAAKFKIDRESYYRKPLNLPKRAILFIDDLPDYLGPGETGAGASAAVKRLFDWFHTYPGF